MTFPSVDLNGAVSIAAAEGKLALANGDTPRAQEKYAEAGRLLEEQIVAARKQAEKHLLRFLAASQYCHGGHYAKALKLCQGIELRLLSTEVKQLFPPFINDVKKRASNDYRKQVNDALVGLWHARNHTQVLELLKEHPYAMDAAGLATVRAVACEELKQYKAAALFHASAIRFAPDDPDRLLTATLPLELSSQDRLDDAWEYVRYQLEVMPNAMTYITASLVCRERAYRVQGWEQQQAILREELDLFEKAWQEFQHWPGTIRNAPEFRRLMGICVVAAAFASWILGDKARAAVLCDRAIDIDASTLARAIRGFVTYPSEQAIDDLRVAAEQGDETYIPYYLLAHDAMNRDNVREARDWVTTAVKNADGQRVESQLHDWLKVCNKVLGSLSEEVNTLFREVLASDPKNEVVLKNYQSFHIIDQQSQPNILPMSNYPIPKNRIDRALLSVAG